MKARISPVTPKVIDGCTSNTAANAMVSAINATRVQAEPVTTRPGQAVGCKFAGFAAALRRDQLFFARPRT